MLYLGDNEGYVHIYRVDIHSKRIDFDNLTIIKAHDSKINGITISSKANLFCTCSDDGTLSLYNLYSRNNIFT
jgi:WD40 repeat protein